ncbi:hypothetical protein [Enterovibrio calviensis]|uniref:hypothetical protein n=1 Tax=Enterovibrio calviensis TaxID=91359 RepID=UPI000A8F53A2|nr:hypothetical protein [Enterovibrio calviensis]
MKYTYSYTKAKHPRDERLRIQFKVLNPDHHAAIWMTDLCLRVQKLRNERMLLSEICDFLSLCEGIHP